MFDAHWSVSAKPAALLNDVCYDVTDVGGCVLWIACVDFFVLHAQLSLCHL